MMEDWTFRATCWGCGASAALQFKGQYEHADAHPSGYDFVQTYRTMACPSCGTPSILHFDSNMSWDDEPYLVKVGLAGESFPDVPPEIAAAADEAVKCCSAGLHRSAQLLARAAVEAVCKELGKETGSLASKIASLHAEGKLSQVVFEEVTEIRSAGNDMAHGDFLRSPEPEEAVQTVEWMKNLLQDVYQRPAAAKRRREARLSARAGRTEANQASSAVE